MITGAPEPKRPTPGPMCALRYVGGFWVSPHVTQSLRCPSKIPSGPWVDTVMGFHCHLQGDLLRAALG